MKDYGIGAVETLVVWITQELLNSWTELRDGIWQQKMHIKISSVLNHQTHKVVLFPKTMPSNFM